MARRAMPGFRPVGFDDADPSDHRPLEAESARPDAIRATAETFADEFARLGLSAPGIMRIFADPSYRGPHRALLALGEVVVRRIVARAVARWPGVRIVEPRPDEIVDP
jgi:hypothetical protein